jgi:hypothetical protein
MDKALKKIKNQSRKARRQADRSAEADARGRARVEVEKANKKASSSWDTLRNYCAAHWEHRLYDALPPAPPAYNPMSPPPPGSPSSPPIAGCTRTPPPPPRPASLQSHVTPAPLPPRPLLQQQSVLRQYHVRCVRRYQKRGGARGPCGQGGSCLRSSGLSCARVHSRLLPPSPSPLPHPL